MNKSCYTCHHNPVCRFMDLAFCLAKELAGQITTIGEGTKALFLTLADECKFYEKEDSPE